MVVTGAEMPWMNERPVNNLKVWKLIYLIFLRPFGTKLKFPVIFFYLREIFSSQARHYYLAGGDKNNQIYKSTHLHIEQNKHISNISTPPGRSKSKQPPSTLLNCVL